jgi:hypothetical protein
MVAGFHFVEFNANNLPNSQVSEPFIEKRSCTAKSNNSDLCVSEQFLPRSAKQQRLPAVKRVGCYRRFFRRWIQSTNIKPDNRDTFERETRFVVQMLPATALRAKTRAPTGPPFVMSSSAG